MADCATAAPVTRPKEALTVICGGKGWSQTFLAVGGSLTPLAAILAASAFPKDTGS